MASGGVGSPQHVISDQLGHRFRWKHGCTTKTPGPRHRLATGAMSRTKLKPRLSYRVALNALTEETWSRVEPFGTARTTASVAILLPAPGRFSMMSGWPRRCDSG